MTKAYALLRPLIFCLPTETAHHGALTLLRSGLLPSARADRHASLAVEAFGLSFKNPVGLAAGFDKNAAALSGLLKQGFGFIEAGTVTPKPQSGNPQPRLFRLVKDEAVVNRLGFNNDGLLPFVQRLSQRNKQAGIVGANVGKNKDSEDAVADYVAGLQAVYPYADYITINISSPNSPGLRALQKREALGHLLQSLQDARMASATQHGRQVPMLLKVAPDLESDEQEDIAHLVVAHRMNGLIVSNTTISRPASLQGAAKSEQGGLSGKPLFELSTETLRNFYRLTGGRLPLIGVGGISSAEEAYTKIRAGATLVQLYTALIYQGFGLVSEIQDGLAQLLARDGFSHVSQAIGADA